MDYDYNDRKQASVYSRRLKAGKRRTYFFDIRQTRGNDFFLTITESRKKFNDDGYERHKIFIYKEDFNKFQSALSDAVNYAKTELMPDFDFDAFRHESESADDYQMSQQARGVDHHHAAQETSREIASSEVEEAALEASEEAEETAEVVDESPIMNVSSTSAKLASEQVDKW